MRWSLHDQEPVDELPDRIMLSNGDTRSLSAITEEELKDAGWREVETPQHNDETHRAEWGTNSDGEAAWVYIELTDTEKYMIRPDLAPDAGEGTNVDNLE